MQKIISRYAKSVYEVAEKNQQISQLEIEIKNLIAYFEENKQLNIFLQSIITEDRKKVTILNQLTENDSLLQSLILVLKTNKRLNYFLDILLFIHHKIEQEKGNQKAIVISAVPLTDNLKTKILKKLPLLTKENKNYILENIIDKSILGGILIKANNIEYDASLLSKFNNIKYHLTN